MESELSRPASSSAALFLLLREEEIGGQAQLFSAYAVGSEGGSGVQWDFQLIPCVSLVNHGQIQRQIKGKLRHSGWTQDGGSFESETGTSWGLIDIAAATTFVYHLGETSGQESIAQILRTGALPIRGR